MAQHGAAAIDLRPAIDGDFEAGERGGGVFRLGLGAQHAARRHQFEQQILKPRIVADEQRMIMMFGKAGDEFNERRR